MSAILPVSEDLVSKMAELTTRDTVSLSQFQERYRRQNETFQSQKNIPNRLVEEYCQDVARCINLLSEKGQKTLKKLLDVLNNQEGIFSASDVVEGTANIYLYKSTCKSIRRDIKYLAAINRQEAEKLKAGYLETVTMLHERFFGVCNEHLSKELQGRAKGREKVTNVTALNSSDQSFNYKIIMADHTIETLHKLRMDLTLHPTMKHRSGTLQTQIPESDLKKLRILLDFTTKEVTERMQLPTQQDRDDIARSIKELRIVIHRLDFDAAYTLRSHLNCLLETFANKISSFAVEHVLRKDLEARQLVGTIYHNPTLLPATQLLDLQTATNTLIEDSRKLSEAIMFATAPTKKLNR